MTEDVPGYRVLEKVGEGGFSVVYRAYQERLDRQVALKVLSISAVDDAAMKRFQRECKITGRLSGHPNIVTVLDTGTTRSDRPYIAMEYFEHGALTDRLQREGPLAVPEVLRIGVKMAGALAATHETEVLHRDVKPQNILISRYGEPALADFGIARLVDSFDATHTQAFTPHHAAPEVLEGRPPGVASDIYSLGSTLYQLLAGLPAFKGPNGEGIAQLMLRILHEAPPPIQRDDLPPPVFRAICVAMAKPTDQRYPSAVGFAQHLQQLQSELGLPVTDVAHSATAVSNLGGTLTGDPHGTGTGTGGSEPSPWAPNSQASWQNSGPGQISAPPPPQWTTPGPPAPRPIAPQPVAPQPVAQQHFHEPSPAFTVTGDRPGATTQLERGDLSQGPRRGLVVAAAVAVVGGIAIGIVAIGAFGGGGKKDPEAQNSAPAQSGALPKDQQGDVAPIPPHQIRAAAPRNVRLVSDERTAVSLQWRLPLVSRRLPIVVRVQPTNGRPVVAPGNGATNAAFGGLNPRTGYCFQAGAVLRAATTAGGAPTVAWSKPFCIRGAHARTP